MKRGCATEHVEHTNEAIKVTAGGVRAGGEGMLEGKLAASRALGAADRR